MSNQFMNKYWSEKRRGPLCVFCGAILISFSAVFVRIASTGPAVDGFYRMLFGGIGLVSMGIITGVKFRPTKQQFFYATLAGIFLSSDLLCWHQSIHYVGPGLATVLGNLQVFLLASVGVILYNEKVNWKYFIALPIAFIGLYSLVGINWNELSESYHIGVYLGLLTAVFYMLTVFFLRKLQSLPNSLSPIANISLVSLTSLIYFVLVGVLNNESFVISSRIDFLSLLSYGILGQAIGWLLLTKGLPNTPLSLAGFLILMQPTGSFIFDVLIFKRPTPMIQVMGLTLTLIAIYLSTTGHSQSDPK